MYVEPCNLKTSALAMPYLGYGNLSVQSEQKPFQKKTARTWLKEFIDLYGFQRLANNK